MFVFQCQFISCEDMDSPRNEDTVCCSNTQDAIIEPLDVDDVDASNLTSDLQPVRVSEAVLMDTNLMSDLQPVRASQAVLMDTNLMSDLQPVRASQAVLMDTNLMSDLQPVRASQAVLMDTNLMSDLQPVRASQAVLMDTNLMSDLQPARASQAVLMDTNLMSDLQPVRASQAVLMDTNLMSDLQPVRASEAVLMDTNLMSDLQPVRASQAVLMDTNLMSDLQPVRASQAVLMDTNLMSDLQPVRASQAVLMDTNLMSDLQPARASQAVLMDTNLMSDLQPVRASQAVLMDTNLMSDLQPARVSEAVLMDTRRNPSNVCRPTASVRFQESGVLFKGAATPCPSGAQRAGCRVPGPFDPPAREDSSPFVDPETEVYLQGGDAMRCVRRPASSAFGPTPSVQFVPASDGVDRLQIDCPAISSGGFAHSHAAARTVSRPQSVGNGTIGPFGTFRQLSTMGSAVGGTMGRGSAELEEPESAIPGNRGDDTPPPFVPSNLTQRRVSHVPVAPKAAAQRHVFVSWLLGCGAFLSLVMLMLVTFMVQWVSEGEAHPAKVEVVGKVLYVDGKTYFVRGVNYSPIPKGEDGKEEPYGDYFWTPYVSAGWEFKSVSYLYTADSIWEGIKNKISGHSSWHQVHLQEIARTFNTIRIYSWQLGNDHTDFLDMCHDYGLKVIVTFPMDTALYRDLSAEDTMAEALKNFRHMVRKYKGFPAILMWAISNEPNSQSTGDSYAAASALGRFFHFLGALAEVRDDEEGFGPYHPHPLLVPMADEGSWATEVALYDTAKHDVWGAQAYRGSSFGDLFSRFRSTKPLLVSEYGMDAYQDGPPGSSIEIDATNVERGGRPPGGGGPRAREGDRGGGLAPRQHVVHGHDAAAGGLPRQRRGLRRDRVQRPLPLPDLHDVPPDLHPRGHQLHNAGAVEHQLKFSVGLGYRAPR